jgi:AcrR family transcriptional regulator
MMTGMSAPEPPGDEVVEDGAEHEADERRPGRPRDARATPAILRATLQVIAEEGFARFSVDKVAAAAGVGKATIYRRWPSKEDLIQEAFGQVVQSLPEPDTGTLRGDLLAFNRGLLEQIELVPAIATVIPALVAESAWDPRLQEVLDQFIQVRNVCGYPVVQRAKARGEVPADLPEGLVLDLSSGWFFWRMALLKQLPTDAEVVRMVDGVLDGLVVSPARSADGAGEPPD